MNRRGMPDLMQIRQALRLIRLFPRPRQARQQQRDQQRNDADHHQQLHQRECPANSHHARTSIHTDAPKSHYFCINSTSTVWPAFTSMSVACGFFLNCSAASAEMKYFPGGTFSNPNDPSSFRFEPPPHVPPFEPPSGQTLTFPPLAGLPALSSTFP